MFKLLLALLFVSGASSYNYKCLNHGLCECDTEEELIDCHNKQLTSFPELTSGFRLRGFVVLSLLNNDINPDSIPTEEEIKKRYPDLKIIDLAGNKRIPCDVLESKFSTIGIMTDCKKNEETSEEVGKEEDKDGESTKTNEKENCDSWCRINKSLLRPAYMTAYTSMKVAWEKVSSNKVITDIINFFKG